MNAFQKILSNYNETIINRREKFIFSQNIIQSMFNISDLKEIIRNNSFAEDNDVISRIEQELCAEAHIFAGTQKSSWSIRVVEERSARTKNKDLFNDLFYRGHISAKISVYFDEVICKKKSLCIWF